MSSEYELLVMHKFVVDSAKNKYSGGPEEIKEYLEKLKQEKGIKEVKEQVMNDADTDFMELAQNQMVRLPYPKPNNKYHMVYENFHTSIEPIYFWCLNHLQKDLGFPNVYKLTDVFTSSEHSSFYGAAGQRLGLAQDKVQSYLALIGQFVRNDLFQLVRDLRWIDERVQYHEDSRKGLKAAEITLKGIWVDLVDGKVQGQPVHANIFTMATQLQFSSLPDFFFNTEIDKVENIDKIVDALGITKSVKNVLKRKLHQFMVWRDANYKELVQRKNFELKYLRQHYNILKMYLAWLKPYLHHAERLREDLSKTSSANLISAFEGSLVDIEVLGSAIPEGNNDYYACIMLTFNYRTKPSMDYSDSSRYHRGPVHVGETEITWRAYAWTEEDIDRFVKFKERTDLMSLGEIDNTIKSTVDAIGEDLWKYLKEAEEKIPYSEEEVSELAGKTGLSREEVRSMLQRKKPKKPEKKPGFFDPFTSIGKGFKDMFSFALPKFESSKKKKVEKESARKKAEKAKAQGQANTMAWKHYENFKKAHRMLTW
ncbi:hypothetical protein COV11_01550 [Candidatus Woesearchaeota archaeon CG10_big_fil_rev_8_21_14_0_10_30_7]|nr:MAG: hypothetical protein COV11_01550 [Candidatus Woesearchaeota archaeon CG10_big_fil_rev_8_21_14_0_10_30_7]